MPRLEPGRFGSLGKKPGSKHYYKAVYSISKWDEFVQSRAVGSLLQVCAGGSMLGSMRVDHDRAAPGVNVIASQYKLPLADKAFDTVCCDPIYELNAGHRVWLQRELARVSRQRIIFKAPWIPRATGFECVETWLLASHTCNNVAVLSVLQRSTQMDLLLGPANGHDVTNNEEEEAPQDG